MMVKLQDLIIVYSLLQLRVQHQDQFTINAAPHSEACFCFKLGVMQ